MSWEDVLLAQRPWEKTTISERVSLATDDLVDKYLNFMIGLNNTVAANKLTPQKLKYAAATNGIFLSAFRDWMNSTIHNKQYNDLKREINRVAEMVRE